MIDLPPLPTLSIKQPWAWAILNAGKDRENRSRRQTPGTGWHYLHASLGGPRQYFQMSMGFIREITNESTPDYFDVARGGIVGRILLGGWADEDEGSEWFMGPYALRILKVEPLPFQPVHGQLGFWTYPRTAKA
jgi:hypothetical protein